MSKSKISIALFSIVFALFTTVFISCEKDQRIPPKLEFKTGAGYTSADDTVGTDSTIKVGIIATKTEDELKTFNVSVARDGASTTATVHNQSLKSSEEEHFETDYTFTTRSQGGTEAYSFTITDRDGNVTTKTLTLKVK